MPRKESKGRSANGTGNIRKKVVTKKGKEYTYWEARYTAGYDQGTGKQVQRSITGKTQKEVAQKLREALYEHDQGLDTLSTNMTVRDWLTAWEKDYLGDVKESTAHLYAENIRLYIRPGLGAVKLKDLTSHTIQKFYNRLSSPDRVEGKPLAAKTVRNIHGLLHKILEQAVTLDYLRKNPADACKLPKAVKPEIHPLDEIQMADFLNIIQGHTHEYLYKITLFTGLREGEVLGLTWDCLDMERGKLLVKQQLRKEQKKGGKYYFSPPKNNKSRVLSLAPSVVKLFRLQKAKQDAQRSYAGELWTENNLVFSNQTGGFLSFRTVYDCFKRIMEKIGTPTTRFHDLRHTYAVLSLKAGDDIKTLQENLGHATPAFTLEVYGHITAMMKQTSADRMERMIQNVSSIRGGIDAVRETIRETA